MSSNIALQKASRRGGAMRPRRDDEDDSILGLRNGFDIVMRSRGLIAAITLAITAMGAIYAAVKKPIFEGNMLIQVVPTPSGEKKNMLGEVAATFDQETSAGSEVGVIRSRSVIKNVVTSLRSHIEARPRHFPLVGSRISALRDDLSVPGLFGGGGYCWGAERIAVPSFEVPDIYLGKDFVVTQLGGGRYQLSDHSGGLNASGIIGTPLELAFAGGGKLHLHVASLHALPGAQFLVKRKSELAVVEDIQQALVVAETGKGTGLISVSLRDVDPTAIYSVLSTLGNEYIRQYQQRRTGAAQKSQRMLEAQLPALKQRMELAEEKFNVFRDQNGTANLTEETRLQVQRLAASEQSLLELEQKKADLLVRFGPDHPAIAGIKRQIGLVGSEKKTLGARVRRLPMIEQEMGRLARDVKVTTELYSQVLRTSQELRVISVEQAKGVRLVDAPVIPNTPVNPRSTTIALAAAFGLLMGLLGAFVRQVLVTR